MIRTVSLLAAGVIASTLPLSAQNAGASNRRLTQADLSKSIDALGTGDPVRKAPLSIGDTSSDERQEALKGDDKKLPSGKGPTEILSKEASFDQRTHQAVFAGEVTVKNPEFNIVCDKLTAFLRNDDRKAAAPKDATANGTAKPASAPAPAGGKTGGKAPSGGGGLEKAIAEGSVVITQEKVDADGKPSRSVGRARRAVYDAATGDVVLTGRPSLQQGINTIVASDDSTVMTLNREGRLTINGRSRTLLEESPENPISPNGR